MATSKNNRKKGQKRQPMHSKPVSASALRAEQQRKEEERKSQSKNARLNLLMTIGMLVGLVVAMAEHPRIGYPLTFICALGCLSTVNEDTKHRKLVTACYLIYMLATAFMFYMTMMGQ